MGRPTDDNNKLYLKRDMAGDMQPLELTVFGEGPDEIHDAKIVDRFETPSSERLLLDIGAFDDGMRKYMLAERFASNGWKWTNSFPEMDVLQMASYLEGNANLCNKDSREDYQEYKGGLLRFVEVLKALGNEEINIM